jgi:hypothetical protein
MEPSKCLKRALMQVFSEDVVVKAIGEGKLAGQVLTLLALLVQKYKY